MHDVMLFARKTECSVRGVRALLDRSITALIAPNGLLIVLVLAAHPLFLRNNDKRRFAKLKVIKLKVSMLL